MLNKNILNKIEYDDDDDDYYYYYYYYYYFEYPSARSWVL